MTLMHQLLWDVMQMAIALAKMDLVVKNVMPAKGDLLEANVMNANLMSLVTNVMHVNHINSIIQHVKVVFLIIFKNIVSIQQKVNHYLLFQNVIVTLMVQ